MATEIKKEIELEIAHVLFIDIVGYSKLLINEQRELLQELNQIVRGTDAFRSSEAAEKLIRLPTGDGMALVFSTTPESPVECALEISRALKARPDLPVRMGVHSGPVSGVMDVNDRANVAGAGINIAQRVMDCADAGHILVSKRVADDLAQYRHWQPYLHDLGECELKHGVRLHLVNLHDDELGNPQIPQKFKQLQQSQIASGGRRKISPGVGVALAALLIIGLAVVAVIFTPAIIRSREKAAKNVPMPAAQQPAKTTPEKSIAVLPFENFSGSKENEFFADGVQDDILTALSRVADLKVISRMSVTSYAAGTKRNLREIAQALGVSHVLEGSVRRAGDKVRVTAQLIDARNDAHVWADNYDRDLADVFAIQSEIATIIADQLRAKLSPTEKAAIAERPTGDIPAHDLYVRAKLLYEISSYNSRRMEKLVEATGLLDQAIARDPNFFLAHCLLANTHSLIYFYNLDHTPVRRTLAENAVNAAERLRPGVGETHLVRADFFYRCYLDYDRSLAELDIAQGALPNNAQAFVLKAYIDRRQSRWQESAQNFERALDLDPRNWFYLQQAALSYQFLRQFNKMAAALDRVIAIRPDDMVTPLTRAGIDLHARADLRPLREAVAPLLKTNSSSIADSSGLILFFALCDRDPITAERAIAVMPAHGSGPNATTFPVSFWKGLVARMQKDDAAAQIEFLAAREQIDRTLQDQPDFGPAHCVKGMIDAGLGRKEDAIREGRRACELLPVTQDSVNGIYLMEFLAVIYAWTGEKDLAVEQLKAVLQYPGNLSYGQLRLHPWWDPLRGDRRFEKIVADMAPKK